VLDGEGHSRPSCQRSVLSANMPPLKNERVEAGQYLDTIDDKCVPPFVLKFNDGLGGFSELLLSQFYCLFGKWLC
jgi:hypothetical protein